ncbi:energy transducer TonB [Tunturibacter empetritectus]|uniref:TonB family protein n=1 Tax=Tunturiibacter lichenicola TaxID=2051959 RepID=A0A7W8N7A1_9BACT|nr:energy transducer TonB [Edaphobacter lichenicola]MBB5345830.1 TonB family protein [Edaphobacter lichenicola]
MAATKLSVISFLIGLTIPTIFANPASALSQQAPPAASSAQSKKPDPQANPKQPLPNPDFFGIYHAGDGVAPPKLIFSVEPEFSEKARKKKIHGNCVVSLIVRTDGTTTDIHVAKSIADTVPMKEREAALTLDENAVRVVPQYRFTPATYRGTPVPYRMTVEVNFMIF